MTFWVTNSHNELAANYADYANGGAKKAFDAAPIRVIGVIRG